jgi:hypothetical protein
MKNLEYGTGVQSLPRIGRIKIKGQIVRTDKEKGVLGILARFYGMFERPTDGFSKRQNVNF